MRQLFAPRRLFAASALLSISALGNSSSAVDKGQARFGHAPHRTLQTGSNVVYIDAIVGTAFTSAEEGGAQLQNAERGTPGDSTTTITTSTTAQYEMYFTPPDVTGATGFTLSFVGQLDGAAWTVDIFDFSTAVSTWVAAGTLTGITSTGWGDVNIDFVTTAPADFIATSSVMLIQLSATSTQVGYLDYVGITATGSTPAVTPAPVTAPVAAPTSTGGSTAVYVDKITGADILSTQIGGAQITTAELGATSDTTTSIEFASTASEQAAYEMYFVAPSAVTGPFTITITAQLGTGAVASDWKVDMYSFLPVGSDDWELVGDLTGVTSGSWSTIALMFAPATPTNFVEPSVNEFLVQLRTEGAAGAQSVFVDQVVISVGPAVVSPTPAPTPIPVQVDLVPCILATDTIAQDVGSVASAYLFQEFFKGFWTATQNAESPPAAVLDLLVDADHGKCSVVFVGIVPSAAQKLQLQDYSRKFNVRIVYFDAADTILDTEVQTRLGMQSRFDEPSVGAARVKRTGGTADSIAPADMITDPTQNNIFNRPVVQITALPAGVTILAQYADASGTVIPGIFFTGAQNAAIVEYIGTDGLEEMHVFLGLAWFDTGSWAWAHFIAEWGTKGIFQGERRFYLGGVVDDLFLSTGVWIYDPPSFFGPEERLTGADLLKFQNAEGALNTQYGASIKTEHAFNGLGVLDKVGSTLRSWTGADADIGLLPKGDAPNPSTGIPQISLPNWLSTTFNPANGQTGMQEEYASGLYASDDLLARVQADLDAFYWQSHTLTHLSRDNLGKNDCDIEDGGNAQMAVLLGLFDNDNYNWRSMTSPGITGLFNPNCLQSGAENLMKCYPGDNTYSGAPLTAVSLVDSDNQFHSLTTTVATNGYAGMQIIPRFATNVYYNCVTGQCLIDENEKIRRDVCGCAELDPSLAQGVCDASCASGTQSFNDIASSDSTIGPLEALYQTEERTTTRYILTGRRDKYMFHQANVISTTWATSTTDPMYVSPTPTNNASLMEYWYIRVVAEMAKFINTGSFPVQTLKFDNLCHNFYQHEDLDNSGAVLTATKDTTGAITGMTLATTNNNGAPIPLTVPTASAASILASLGSLTPSKTETYGADTTYTFAAGTLNTGNLSKPAVSELAAIPQATLTEAAQTVVEVEAEADLDAEISSIVDVAEEARVDIEEEAGNQGFVVPDLAGEIVVDPDAEAAAAP